MRRSTNDYNEFDVKEIKWKLILLPEILKNS